MKHYEMNQLPKGRPNAPNNCVVGTTSERQASRTVHQLT